MIVLRICRNTVAYEETVFHNTEVVDIWSTTSWIRFMNRMGPSRAP